MSEHDASDDGRTDDPEPLRIRGFMDDHQARRAVRIVFRDADATDDPTGECDRCGAEGDRYLDPTDRTTWICEECGGDWNGADRDALRTDDGDDDRTETEKLEALRDWLDRGAERSGEAIDDDGPRTDRAMDPEPVHAAIDDGRVHYSDGTDDGWLRINRSALVDTEGSR